ncbi:ribosomal protein S18-alanine N-acetyltransferase [Williamsia sp. CHRR-6]|uniref:ribosomal protein S18-alanine N-acetyltransferase n=1 Tax=Williamsia sp. CHRR-6 TaxID=2835871 RepID=UPI001BDAE9ED|nr:ribosomal protein S18-alanine N-acetyltransferase [Williamsia sp. CHRR-6]MBT0566752.1 ribosomal protein S18-alanine N-acetyltransferase [Williamsia sp. CHRR-6]
MITELRRSDVARCAELEGEIFAGDSPWPAQAFVAEITAPHNRYFALRDDDSQLIGYAGIALLGTVDDRECEIHTIAVDPAQQGRGHGRALMDALLAVADDADAQVFLEVRTDNDPALALYRRNGFEIIGVRRNYYQPSGADAYTMRRPRARELGTAVAQEVSS